MSNSQDKQVTIAHPPLSEMFGINAFEWDFLEGPNHEPLTIYEPKMALLKPFSNVRHYLDWSKLEAKPGSYTYNPAFQGGWNYDMMYERCKKDGITVLACIKLCPDWLLESYPKDERDNENVPAPYGLNRENPASYVAQAKMAFQFAARYGNNTKVDQKLLSVNSTPRWTNDPVNKIKVGLGLIKYIECDNERDKWWKGKKAYQTAREYAANLSAFYDGNKGTLGKNVGVKTADPNMKVVMAGLASADAKYVKDMIDWCKEKRGYKADGSIDLCFDVINYHYYSNDSPSPQSGNTTTGIAPELSGAGKVADEFIAVSQKYAGNIPVWVTETGYDVNPKSPQRAPAVGNKSNEDTQADWILRTSFLYARHGIQKVFYYMLNDVNKQNETQYASSGLAEGLKLRPAGNYLLQVFKLMGNYTYQKSLSSNSVVDLYAAGNKKMYVLYVPDGKGRTQTYELNLGNVSSANIYRLQSTSATIKPETLKPSGGKLKLVLTETPVFVEVE